MQSLRELLTPRAKRIVVALCFVVPIVGADLAVNYAYGSEVRSMAIRDAVRVVTDYPFRWTLFVVGSWVVGFVVEKKHERVRVLHATGLAIMCFLGGLLLVFVVSDLFLSPHAMYKTAKVDAQRENERANRSEQKAQDADAARIAAENRANESEAREARARGAAAASTSVDPHLVAARQAHLQSLREVLQDEAKQLRTVFEAVSISGHRFAGVAPDEIARNEDYDWNRNVLMSDFFSHFSVYAAKRAQLREDMSSHDRRMREVVDRIRKQLSWPKNVVDDRRLEVAFALLHKYTRNGFGMRFEVGRNGGYGYSYSTGGGASTGGGPVPEYVRASWDAYSQFAPDDEFKAACTRLSEQAENLARRLDLLSKEAYTLAEVTSLQGDCDFVRPR